MSGPWPGGTNQSWSCSVRPSQPFWTKQVTKVFKNPQSLSASWEHGAFVIPRIWPGLLLSTGILVPISLVSHLCFTLSKNAKHLQCCSIFPDLFHPVHSKFRQSTRWLRGWVRFEAKSDLCWCIYVQHSCVTRIRVRCRSRRIEHTENGWELFLSHKDILGSSCFSRFTTNQQRSIQTLQVLIFRAKMIQTNTVVIANPDRLFGDARGTYGGVLRPDCKQQIHCQFETVNKKAPKPVIQAVLFSAHVLPHLFSLSLPFQWNSRLSASNTGKWPQQVRSVSQKMTTLCPAQTNVLHRSFTARIYHNPPIKRSRETRTASENTETLNSEKRGFSPAPWLCSTVMWITQRTRVYVFLTWTTGINR